MSASARKRSTACRPSSATITLKPCCSRIDDATRTIHWRIDTLPARESNRVTLTAEPIEDGPQKLIAQGTSAGGLQAEDEHAVKVEGIAAILWLGETYMLAEHFICNFIWPVQGADVVASKIVGEDPIYACSRVDLSGLIWAPAAAQIAVMLLVAWMVHRAKKGMT